MTNDENKWMILSHPDWCLLVREEVHEKRPAFVAYQARPAELRCGVFHALPALEIYTTEWVYSGHRRAKQINFCSCLVLSCVYSWVRNCANRTRARARLDAARGGIHAIHCPKIYPSEYIQLLYIERGNNSSENVQHPCIMYSKFWRFNSNFVTILMKNRIIASPKMKRSKGFENAFVDNPSTSGLGN